jgi:hypothetical protein
MTEFRGCESSTSPNLVFEVLGNLLVEASKIKLKFVEVCGSDSTTKE